MVMVVYGLRGTYDCCSFWEELGALAGFFFFFYVFFVDFSGVR